MKRDDLSRSLVAFDQASSLVAVVELGLGSWLVAGLVPNLSRQPLKKLRPGPDALLRLLLRWGDQAATKAGGRIKRMVVAFEAGRDRDGPRPFGAGGSERMLIPGSPLDRCRYLAV
jgi:transposase